MPRYFWIAASISILVAAFSLLGIAHRQVSLAERAEGAGSRATGLDVIVYTVPPPRGQAITDALNTVLLTAPRDGVQPLGAARLSAPDLLVVSAPGRMQGSIKKAIASLSEGASTEQGNPDASALDLWLVEATRSGPDDPRLIAAGQALDVARMRFGHQHFRLLDRVMLVARADGEAARAGGSQTRSSVELYPHDAATVEAEVEFQVIDRWGTHFESKLLLPEGQWQLVGLLPVAGEGNPERLLLMRQTRASSSPAPGP